MDIDCDKNHRVVRKLSVVSHWCHIPPTVTQVYRPIGLTSIYCLLIARLGQNGTNVQLSLKIYKRLLIDGYPSSFSKPLVIMGVIWVNTSPMVWRFNILSQSEVFLIKRCNILNKPFFFTIGLLHVILPWGFILGFYYSLLANMDLHYLLSKPIYLYTYYMNLLAFYSSHFNSTFKFLDWPGHLFAEVDY